MNSVNKPVLARMNLAEHQISANYTFCSYDIPEKEGYIEKMQSKMNEKTA
jgi:hypothetical protein